MGDSVLTEYLPRWKKRRLDKASGESNSGSTHREFGKYDPYDDEYIRQYLLYYYQFHKSEGFVIDWDKLDYWFDTYPVSQYKTNDEAIRDVACRAISQHNEDKGTRLVFVDHVSASYMWSGEIAAVQVDPPPPLFDDDPEFPTILFTVTGPGSGYMSIPEVAFTRIPAEVEPVFYP